MAQQNTPPSLQPHQLKIVDVFRYEHSNIHLDEQLARYAPAESVSSRFLIKMEIARQAKKCYRIIDLRDLQPDWNAFEYDDITHYFDEATANDFKDICRNYHGYTQGVYETVIKRAKERDREARINPAVQSVPAINFTSLTHFFQRKEQRLYYVSPVSIFIEEPFELPMSQLKRLAITGATTDISPTGLCIKIPGIKLPKIVRKIYVRFNGFERDFNSATPIFIRYDVLTLSVKQANYYYRIRMSDDQDQEITDEFKERLTKFIFSQLRRYRVPIDNTQDAVQAKGYEQFAVGKMHALPLFVQYELGVWVPRCVFLTSYNEAIVQRLTDDQHNSMLADFINQTSIQQALQDEAHFVQHYLFTPVVTSASGTQSSFVSIPIGDCQTDPMARQLAQQVYLKSQGNLTLFRVDGVFTTPEKECYIPSSLPDSSGEMFQVLNQQPAERARLLVSGYQRMVTITDESDLLTSLHLFDDVTSTQEVPKEKLLEYIPPKLKFFRQELYLVKNEIDDRRVEDRFLYSMPVFIHTERQRNEKFFATTIDISTKGLKIQTERELPYHNGDPVYIDFPELPGVGSKPLEYQTYRIVRIAKHVIQLVITGHEYHHEGRKALRTFIQNNLNSLSATGCRDPIYGLSRALRNIYTHNHPFPIILLKRHEKNRYISDMALSNNTVLPPFADDTHDDPALLHQILTHEGFIQMLNTAWGRLKEITDVEIITFMVTLKEKRNEAGYYIIIKNTAELTTAQQLHDVFTQSSVLGQTRLLRVLIGKRDKPFNKYFKDELYYLTRYAPNRAKLVLDDIAKVEGVGFLTDITDVVTALF